MLSLLAAVGADQIPVRALAQDPGRHGGHGAARHQRQLRLPHGLGCAARGVCRHQGEEEDW